MSVDHVPRRVGFYTTRFVVADNETDAESLAVSALRRSRKLRTGLLNGPEDRPVIHVEEVEKVAKLRSSTGYAFYYEDAEGPDNISG